MSEHGDPERVWAHEIKAGDLIARIVGATTEWHEVTQCFAHGETVHILVVTGGMPSTKSVRRGRFKRVRVRRALVTEGAA